MNIVNSPQAEKKNDHYNSSRRGFLKLAGGLAGGGLVLAAACKRTTPPSNVYLGSGDTALLNFLYLLQQIEAAFYTQAVATPYYGLTQLESLCLTDLRDQEIAHSQFFKSLLGTNAITAISPNFSSVTFADRTSTLTGAAAIEDMVIAGFIGASTLFSNTSYPQEFIKIISVEGRHSAYCRDVLNPNTFSDTTVTDSNGLNDTMSPLTVLATALNYTHTSFDSSNLPN